MLRTLVASALLLGCLAQANQLPIHYTPSLHLQAIANGKMAEYLKANEEYRLKTSQDASTPVIDYEDMAYMIQITLGTPAQTFVEFLDSGSANLWVPDVTCAAGKDTTCGTYCKNVPAEQCSTFCDTTICCGSQHPKTFGVYASSDACQSKHRFNSSSSSSYSPQTGTFDITYQTGDVNGFLGSDVFCFGGTNICTDNTQVFGQAKTIGPNFGKQPIDGIIGLGWPSLAVDSIKPPMNTLIDQNKLNKPLFVVQLYGIGSTSTLQGGTFTIGDLDTTNCESNVNYVPLTATSFWQFKMDGVSVGTKYSNSIAGGWQAMSDTASTFIGGPTAVISAVAKAVGATYLSEFQSYFIDCEANPDPVTFTINGKNYNITPKNYILSVGSKLCMFAFFPRDAGGFYPTWMLGPPFMREYCQIYDYGNKQLGMSKVIAK